MNLSQAETRSADENQYENELPGSRAHISISSCSCSLEHSFASSSTAYLNQTIRSTAFDRALFVSLRDLARRSVRRLARLIWVALREYGWAASAFRTFLRVLTELFGWNVEC